MVYGHRRVARAIFSSALAMSRMAGLAPLLALLALLLHAPAVRAQLPNCDHGTPLDKG